ncbi:MAG: hypothetical protein ABI888_00165 [Chloroflexota bacterium]
MTKERLALGIAIVAGLLLAFYDSRTDDTGIEVGLILISVVGLSVLAPRRWWLIAALVIVPIPVAEFIARTAAAS